MDSALHFSGDKKRRVSFIHASDLHLGCYQYHSPNRANDFIRALQQILELAVRKSVDFLLFAGDVFTSLEMLPGKLNQIVNLFQKFQKLTDYTIPIIAIEGNHDIRRFSRGARFSRGQSWLKLLASLELITLLEANISQSKGPVLVPYDFKLKTGSYLSIKDTLIFGTQYSNESPSRMMHKIAEEISRIKGGKFCILMQHFGIEGQLRAVPGISYDEVSVLRGSVDYLALGHFHKQYTIEGWIYNPGSTEATSYMDHSYPRGVFLVEVIRKDFSHNKPFQKHITCVRLANRKPIWRRIHFNTHLPRKEDLVASILSFLEQEEWNSYRKLSDSDPAKPILYLTLEGMNPLGRGKIDQKPLIAAIKENLPLVDVKIYQKFSSATKTIDCYLPAHNKAPNKI